MPEQKQYNSEFCPPAIMPRIGMVCPKCNIGIIRQSQFFEGVYCNNCKWQWRRSKFPPKTAKVPESEEKVSHIEIIGRLDKIEEHLKSLRKGQEILERKITGRE